VEDVASYPSFVLVKEGVQVFVVAWDGNLDYFADMGTTTTTTTTRDVMLLGEGLTLNATASPTSNQRGYAATTACGFQFESRGSFSEDLSVLEM
jgi:hypothetical protein